MHVEYLCPCVRREGTKANRAHKGIHAFRRQGGLVQGCNLLQLQSLFCRCTGNTGTILPLWARCHSFYSCFYEVFVLLFVPFVPLMPGPC